MAESGLVRFLYGTGFGRVLLKGLSRPSVSRAVGKFLDTQCSAVLNKPFIKRNGIDLSLYEDTKYRSFNDCFTRKILPQNRPVDMTPSTLVSPCDGRLSVYDIDGNEVIPVKQSCYSIASLLRDGDLAEKYNGGKCVVIRLCVNNYHRYIYIDNCKKGENVYIKGVLHTVRPTALERYPVFTENCREYTVMETENFGTVTEVEVGALLVGKIENHHGAGKYTRGEEKGLFLYGGSTVILLFEKGAVTLNPKFSQDETEVKMGEKISV